MNRNQKALTLIALAAFVFIVFINPFFIPTEDAGHYPNGEPYRVPSRSLELVDFGHTETGVWGGEVPLPHGNFGLKLQPDGLKLLTLAVTYFGLFFVLRTERKP